MTNRNAPVNPQETIKMRPDLVGLKPYTSFDQPIKVRLNTNENPYALPDAVVESITSTVKQSVAGMNRYPSDNYLELKQNLVDLVAKRDGPIGLTVTNITAGNGSNEIMAQIFAAFGGPRSGGALTFTPSYSMYPQYARDSFTKLHICPRVGDNFELDKWAAFHCIEEHNPSIIIITNPNNPTGTWTGVETIREILQFTQTSNNDGRRPIVVVDEAYVDFRDPEFSSAVALINEFDNLVVVRTLSKAFSFAGIRFGYALGSELMIDSLKIVRMPYNLSTLTQNVVSTVVKNHSDLMLKAVDGIRNTRNKLNQWLRVQDFSDLLNVVPSQSNFIQIGLTSDFESDDFDSLELQEWAQDLHNFLISRGVQIRVVGPAGYFRVTIGTAEEIEEFKSFLVDYMSQFRLEDDAEGGLNE